MPAGGCVESGDEQVLTASQFTELYEFSSRQPLRRYSVRRLCKVTNDTELKQFGVFLSREVKLRLAHAAAELAYAPFGFGQMEAIKTLRHLHEKSYVDLAAARMETHEDMLEFCRLMHGVHRRHHVTTDLISRGIAEFVRRNHLDESDEVERIQMHLEGGAAGRAAASKAHAGGFAATTTGGTTFDGIPGAVARPPCPVDLYTEYHDFQQYLEGIFANRVKVRFLIGHYVECVRQLHPEAAHDLSGVPLAAEGIDWEDKHAAPRFVGQDPDAFTGTICRTTNMVTVVHLAVDNARRVMSDLADGAAVPEVSVEVHGDPDFTFPYSPKQAFNVITSLVAHSIKEEMRAKEATGRPCAPIHVLVSQDRRQNDVVVRIKDNGRGIPLEHLDACTTFLHSGRKTQMLAASKGEESIRGWMRSSLRLPVATVLSRVFGGDLTIASVDGDSTTTCFCAPTAWDDTLSF